MKHTSRRSRSQKQAIIQQMLQEARRLTEQGVPLGEVRQRVAEVRDDLLAARRQGIQLIPVSPTVEGIADSNDEDI